MRVLLVNSHAPDTGVGRYAFSILRHLQRLPGLEAHMVCLYPFRPDADVKNVKSLTKLPYSPVTNALNYFVNPYRLPKEFDVYHLVTQTLGNFARCAKPSVISIHDTMPLEFKLKTLYENAAISGFYSHFVKQSIRAASKATRVICPTEFCKSKVLQYLNVREKAISVVPYGVDREIFHPGDKLKAREVTGLPTDQHIVLNVSSEDYRKNIPMLVKAFKTATSSMKKALLVRIGRRTGLVNSVIESLGLSDRVTYFENVSHKTLAEFYRAADVFVSPSTYNGFTFPPLEAMSCGCPVITSNTSAYPEIVGESGILVSPHDIQKLSQAIAQVLQDESLRASMANRGVSRSRLFTWDQCVSRTVRVYREALEFANQ